MHFRRESYQGRKQKMRFKVFVEVTTIRKNSGYIAGTQQNEQ